MNRRKPLFLSLLILCILSATSCSHLTSIDGTTANAKQEKRVTVAKKETETSEQTIDEKVNLRILIPYLSNRDHIDEVINAFDIINHNNEEYHIDMVLVDDPDINIADYDGMIIPGGCHVSPELYGSKTTVNCKQEYGLDHECNPDLDELELKLLETFVKAKKPVLGICRGMQLINVYFDGSLNQDIGHSHYGKWIDTNVLSGNGLENLYGISVRTYHYHHQVIKELGSGLEQTMECNGYVEGFEHTLLPIIGVQWHPELMSINQTAETEDRNNGQKFLLYFCDIMQEAGNKKPEIMEPIGIDTNIEGTYVTERVLGSRWTLAYEDLDNYEAVEDVPEAAQVYVLGEKVSGGSVFYEIEYFGQKRYVKASSLRCVSKNRRTFSVTGSEEQDIVYVNSEKGIYLHYEKKDSKTSRTTDKVIPYGTELVIKKIVDGWGLTEHNGEPCWVNMSWVGYYQGIQKVEVEIDLVPGEEYLELKKEPDEDSRNISNIPEGTILTPSSYKNGWANVTYKGDNGWIKLLYTTPCQDNI